MPYWLGPTPTLVSHPTVTSGLAFTPSVQYTSSPVLQIDGSSSNAAYTITMGPTTGAEHRGATNVGMNSPTDVVDSFRVPPNWKVITLTAATLPLVTVITG